jgi:hypothetical protein
MDILFFIRAIIFLVAGLVSIIFRKELNTFKNRYIVPLLIRFGFKSKVKNEIKGYYQLGIGFILISVILFIVSIKS